MLGSMLDSESLTQQAVRRQLAAMPNNFYLIRLIHFVERKPAPAKRLWTAEELARNSVVHSPGLGPGQHHAAGAGSGHHSGPVLGRALWR